MPNKKSAKKELRKTVKRNKQNEEMSKAMKNLVKDSQKAIALGKKEIKKDMSKADAEEAKKKLEAAGAKVELK
jgi:ribosomal protein S20